MAETFSVRLIDWKDRSSLAEISIEKHTTVGGLRSILRDCEELKPYRHRLFSRWWIKNKGPLLTEIPSAPAEDTSDFDDIENCPISDVGIGDESLLVLQAPGDHLETIELNTQNTDFSIGRLAFETCVAVDQRSQRRTDQLLGHIMVLHKEILSVQKSLQEEAEQNRLRTEAIVAQTALLEARTLASEEANRRLVGELSILAQQQKLALSSVIGINSVVSVNEVSSAMTAVTPCDPSKITIRYSTSEKVDASGQRHPAQSTVIQRHEEYFKLPAEDRRERPVHFPNARIKAGAKVLVEFSYTAPSSGALLFGFAPVDLDGHNNQSCSYTRERDTYVLSLYGTNIRRTTTIVKELTKFTRNNPNRVVALLLDRKTDPTKPFLRVFCNEDGLDGQMKPYYDEEIPLTLTDKDYVPVANPAGTCTLTVHGIYFDDNIPLIYGTAKDNDGTSVNASKVKSKSS